jgi:hypothetical protein
MFGQTLKTDFYKALFHGGFVLSVLLFFLLCFTSVGYVTSDTSITVGELALFYSREQITGQLGLSRYSLFLSGLGSYNIMFAPMVAALPSIPQVCRERSSGYLRFVMPRCGVTKRCLSWQISAMLSGGLALLMGYGLYGLVCFLHFPGMTEEMGAWLNHPAGVEVLISLVGVFLYGVIATLLPVLMASVSKNAYFILCFSFAVFYAYTTALGQLASRLLNSENTLDYQRLMVAYPLTITQTANGQFAPLVFWLGVAVVTFLVLRAVTAHRFDRGC